MTARINLPPKKKREYISANRKERSVFYSDKRWKPVRLARLHHATGLCEICQARGILTPATQVHHKDTFLNKDNTINWYKALDFNNLIALCQPCHNFVHNGTTTHGLDMVETIKRMDKEWHLGRKDTLKYYENSVQKNVS